MIRKALIFEIHDGIAYLTLSNPPANQMNSVFFSELLEICHSDIIKENYKGLIIRSNGRHFSSGADVGELLEIIRKEPDSAVPTSISKNLNAFSILNHLRKPIVALIKGICYGSGFELALCANYRLAAPNSYFALPETAFGLMPGLGGIYALHQMVGAAKTAELVLTAQTISADEALKLGIINDILLKEKLESKARDIILQV
ncbi:MAG: enoyl-CoA hydratase/isomerase family protein [Bacteroidales bacterium]|nr:enoyl-CoA hydratase/isomerase family protein [Bacteroidales bacterium]